MRAKEAKQKIKKACREIFPAILPSRLQEARRAILAHLGVSVEDFGYFPSGGNKFDNLCSQVVKDLKTSGEMSTDGWTWHWKTQEVQETQEVQDVPFSLAMMEEVGVIPTLYQIEDEETLVRLVSSTPCFGKVLDSDPECQGCPLLSFCKEKKDVAKEARKERKERKEVWLEEALAMGYDLRKVKVPNSARINDAVEIKAKAPTSCIVSKQVICEGEVAYHIPSWGMVKKAVGEAYINMKEI